jgi:hypothetical protein
VDPPVDADLRAIVSRLTDPTVPAEEKRLIRDTLRHLAGRELKRVG